MPNNQKLFIREALEQDAESIATVQVSAWKTAYRGLVPDRVLDSMKVKDRTTRWQKILQENSGTTLVAEIEDRIIGWSGFGASRDDDRNSIAGEVYGFYVAPTLWRSGVGTQLWRASVNGLSTDGFETVDVWVLAGNQPARRFYEHVGCTLDEVVKKTFVGDGFSLPEVRYTSQL